MRALTALAARQPPRQAGADAIVRAAFAAFLACGGGNERTIAKARWPNDTTTARIINRGAVDAATTAVPEWAGVLAPSILAEFFSNLAQSAASKLIAASPRITLLRAATLSFSRQTSAPAYLAWVGEGFAIPVASFPVTSGAVLGPGRKFAVITVASIELFERSNAEAVFSTMLRESAGLTLDGAMFDASPASDIRPAGLLDGVAALVPAAGADAMKLDIAALVGAVAAAGADPSNVVIIASPTQAAAVMVGLPDLKIPVWSSLALAAGVVIAIDASGFASGFTGEPDIESSRDAVVHMSDTPLPIGTPGAPPTVASPVVSAFQAGLVVTRLVCDCAWTMRGAGLVAHLADVTW